MPGEDAGGLFAGSSWWAGSRVRAPGRLVDARACDRARRGTHAVALSAWAGAWLAPGHTNTAGRTASSGRWGLWASSLLGKGWDLCRAPAAGCGHPTTESVMAATAAASSRGAGRTASPEAGNAKLPAPPGAREGAGDCVPSGAVMPRTSSGARGFGELSALGRATPSGLAPEPAAAPASGTVVLRQRERAGSWR